MKTKTLKLFAAIVLMLACFASRGQFWEGNKGLLHSPTADLFEDGTIAITNSVLNKHSISSWYWGYNTLSYGISISLWSRLEIGYVCVLIDGSKNPIMKDNTYYGIMHNQDRHFNAKVLLIKEGDFGLKWMPAIALGVSDPISGATSADYSSPDVSGEGNGFFNRHYAVATKHFSTSIGTLGTHLGYQYNKRTDFPMNGPCAAIDWEPVWLNKPNFSLKAIAEYDSRSFNIGFIATIWQDRFEAMFELMALKWVNFGIRYKLHLKS